MPHRANATPGPCTLEHSIDPANELQRDLVDFEFRVIEHDDLSAALHGCVHSSRDEYEYEYEYEMASIRGR